MLCKMDVVYFPINILTLTFIGGLLVLRSSYFAILVNVRFSNFISKTTFFVYLPNQAKVEGRKL